MKLYLGDKCWDKLFELPKNVQLRVRDFQRKFKENPFSPAINLEKIASFEDDSLRTARIDDTYRAIIGVASGDTYCLLYIDHHDEAMRWAQHKRFAWNSYTNSFQVTSITMEEVVEQRGKERDDTVFAKYSDEQLLRIGVPEHQLPLVRSIKDMDDLEKAESSLSGDVFEYLFYLMDDGTDINNIITEVEAGKEQDGDSTINNKRNFIEITDDEELERVIAEGTEKWQIFLHPSQRLLVEKSYAGSLKVTGGGGTGKGHRVQRRQGGQLPEIVHPGEAAALQLRRRNTQQRAGGVIGKAADEVHHVAAAVGDHLRQRKGDAAALKGLCEFLQMLGHKTPPQKKKSLLLYMRKETLARKTGSPRKNCRKKVNLFGNAQKVFPFDRKSLAGKTPSGH